MTAADLDKAEKCHTHDTREPVADDPTFEDAVCELCGAAPTDILMRTRDIAWGKPGEFSLARCEDCNLIITTPRPVPADMPRYYEDWYGYKDIEDVRKEQTDSPSNRFIKWMRLRVLERTGPLKEGMKVLDVGAGFGAQMEYYIRKRGVTGTTLDFDPLTCEHSLVRDTADVRSGDLLDAGFDAESFDVVTMYETLEHVYHPKATLEEARRILKPGGRLLVEVPDFGSPLRRLFGRFWFPLMVPSHLHHFTKDSLRRVVSAAGLTPVRQAAMFVPFETTASFLLGYCHHSGASMYDVSRLGRLLRRRPIHLPFFVFLFLWTVLFDLGIQTSLWTLKRTGAQALIATKPMGE
jgi:SAM-dependent methyltransferase